MLTVVGAALATSVVASAAPPESSKFAAHLSGDEEVPERDTRAQGRAMFRAEGEDLAYKLIVANIDNVVAAHIHCDVPGENGPVGVTLFMGAAASGRSSGVLVQGDITAPDAGNACGWTTIEDVVEAMRAGAAYVNVHTSDGVAPPDTGPGDFPGGEVRGQLRELGPD